MKSAVIIVTCIAQLREKMSLEKITADISAMSRTGKIESMPTALFG
jgi:hypothetical protein